MKDIRLKIILVISVYFLTVVVADKDICDDVSMTCLPAIRCLFFGNMKKQGQEIWLQRYTCQYSLDNIKDHYGFGPIAKGNHICCPNENVWGIENEHLVYRPENTDEVTNDQKKYFNMSPIDYRRKHIWQNNPLIPYSINNYANERLNYMNTGAEERSPNDNNVLNSAQNEPRNYNVRPYTQSNVYTTTVQPSVLNQNPSDNNRYPYPNRGNLRPIYPTVAQSSNLNQGTNDNNQYTQSNNVNQQSNWYPSTDEQPILNQNNDIYNRYPNRMKGNRGKSQCTTLSSFPPEPETGCCGRDYSDADRIIESENKINSNLWRPGRYYHFMQPHRITRSAVNDTVEVSIDSRIAGGVTTDLDQFPWTILLKTTFYNGTHENTFNCGGSLISARYVLTAAHCIYERGSTIYRIELYLAEYDKRTFPIDCVTIPGEGRRCVENILMEPERTIPHPLYDDERLHNDIALLRLRGKAPYTEFVRPICLPKIDIDTPSFSNLPLLVAGWGRNGLYTTDVKQATVVNLVPQRECLKHYPNLSRRHLCAAGRTGEDTCKGDSGGPLMMLYQGRYFVSGIVSGKRADSPCGTAVPSLYTNVYHYIQWIADNITY